MITIAERLCHDIYHPCTVLHKDLLRKALLLILKVENQLSKVSNLLATNLELSASNQQQMELELSTTREKIAEVQAQLLLAEQVCFLYLILINWKVSQRYTEYYIMHTLQIQHGHIANQCRESFKGTATSRWVRWIYSSYFMRNISLLKKFNAQPCWLQTRVCCTLNDFRVFSWVNRNIHNVSDK